MEEPSPEHEAPPADRGVPVALGLGSNVGDRLAHLDGALGALAGAGRVVGRSSVYESPPAGYEDQGDFLNLVVVLRTALEPRPLLEFLERTEREAGRRRTFRNAPRTLDIDIILYGRRVIREPGLSVPHPRWRERPFVLVPFREVAPDWKDPVSGRTVAELAEALDADPAEIRKVSPAPGPGAVRRVELP